MSWPRFAMPVVLTIAVSRLVFSMRDARLRTIARQYGKEYQAHQGWTSLFSTGESHNGEGEDEVLLRNMPDAPKTARSPASTDSGSDDEDEKGRPSITLNISERATGEIEKGEGLLGRERTRAAPRTEWRAGRERGSTFKPPELKWTAMEWFGTPSHVMESVSQWSPDTPVRRWFPFKWTMFNREALS
jgi:hypothetical protein